MPTAAKISRPTTVATMSIAEAKANFSSLITGVQKKQASVTIMRRGVPVARVVPISQERTPLYGSMRGTVAELGDIISPTGIEWTVGEE
jgi:prevent-host-death family protein